MVNFATHNANSINTNQLQVDPTVIKVVSERHSPCIYAGSIRGLYVLDGKQRSSEGEWFPVGSGYQWRLNCLLPINQTILIGTSEAHLMQVKNGNIRPLNSFDQAEG